MRFSRRFFRAASVCAVLSAATTLILIFLPPLYQPVPDFEARMALIEHPAYVLRSWVYLIHPFLVVSSSLAVAVLCAARAAGAASAGLLGMVLWGGTEAGQQSLTLVAMDRTWRAAWPTADAAARELIRTQVASYDVLWDAMYFLIMIAFLVGNIFLAIATWREQGLGRWVSIAFMGGAAVTLPIVIAEVGGPSLPDSVDALLYPAIQPLGRFIVGLWLWRQAGRLRGASLSIGAAP